MKEQILYLDPHDDFHSARDKIGWTQTERLVLVWPRAGEGGRGAGGHTQDGHAGPPLRWRRLDLLLLHRHAARLGAKLGLVTADPEVMADARELGLPVFASVDASHRELWRYRRPLGSLTRAFSRRARWADDTRPNALRFALHASRFAPHRLTRALGLLLFALALAALTALALYVVPAASITLTPASQFVAASLPLVADPARSESDPGAGIIPARLITVEVKASAQTLVTGLADVPGPAATGAVVFTNRVAQNALIPAGVVVRTTAAAPVRFATTRDAELPGIVGATVEVPIEAVAPGPAGNVAGGLINNVEGPLAAQVAVVNLNPTQGGAMRAVPAVGEEDRARLREEVLKQIQAEAAAQIARALGPAEFIAPQSLSVREMRDETYDHFLGEPAESLSLEVRALVGATAVDELQAQAVAFTALLNRIGPGLSLLPETLTFARDPALTADEAGRVAFSITASGSVAPAIDLAALQTSVLGLPLHRARAALAAQSALARPAEIVVWPAWFNRVPFLAFRVSMVVETR